MPREDRRIIFENEEVYKAVYSLCTQKQMKVPPAGQVVSIVEDEKDNKFILNLEDPQLQTVSAVEYSRDFIAAALMLYCRGCGIPLPKSAKKSVLLQDKNMILRVVV